MNSSSAISYQQQDTSSAICLKISTANTVAAMNTRRDLTPEELAESARLKAIYESRKSAARAAGQKLTQADVAEACGWAGQSAFNQYATGRVPLNLEALYKIAAVLKFSPEEVSPRLAAATKLPVAEAPEQSNVAPTVQPKMPYRYPVISWVSAGAWAEAVEPFPPGFSDRYEISDYNSKGAAFWLDVKGDSMTSPSGTSIPEGMMILVDTEADVKPGKLVVAKLPSSNEATFKKLVEDGGIRYLKPLNPDYKMVVCGEDCRIIGVAVRVMGKL
jgi:SOS-response transcriptional repressor LexA